MLHNRIKAAVLVGVAMLAFLYVEAAEDRGRGGSGRAMGGGAREAPAARTPSMSRAQTQVIRPQAQRSGSSGPQQAANQRSPAVKEAISRQQQSVETIRPRSNIQQVSRTPSMSRADINHRPADAPKSVLQQRAEVGKPVIQRQTLLQEHTNIKPPNEQLREFGKQQSGQSGRALSPPTHTELRPQLRDYIQQSRHAGVGERPGGERRQTDFKSMAEQQRLNHEVSRETSDRIRGSHPNARGWFNESFFERHHVAPSYYYRGQNWWRAQSWSTISSWVPWGWSEPLFYDAGGYPLALQHDVYVNYYPETTYQVPAPQVGYGSQGNAQNWLPLGVFAASRDLGRAANSNMFVQLALNKAGDIAGTYYNASTDQIHPLDGIVDSSSQQAFWKVSDETRSPVMSTGLYNLTQDVATVQVSFQDGSEQTWFLTRISQ